MYCILVMPVSILQHLSIAHLEMIKKSNQVSTKCRISTYPRCVRSCFLSFRSKSREKKNKKQELVMFW